MKAVTVLVVDDFADCREMICRLLQAIGCHSIGLGSPDAALERLTGCFEGERVVLITDINMPGMSGLQLSAAVKKRRPGCPVILVSGDPIDVLRAKGLVAPDDLFLEKPFTLNALKSALSRLDFSLASSLLPSSFQVGGG